MGEEAVVLENHAKAAAIRRLGRDIAPPDPDEAAIGALEARNDAKGGGFPASRRPEEGEQGPSLHRERQRFDGGDGAEALRDVLELQGLSHLTGADPRSGRRRPKEFGR